MNISWKKQAKGLISVLYIGKGNISVIVNGFKTNQSNTYFYLKQKDLMRYYKEEFLLNNSLTDIIKDILINHPECLLCGKRERKLLDENYLCSYPMLEFNRDYTFEVNDITYVINIKGY